MILKEIDRVLLPRASRLPPPACRLSLKYGLARRRKRKLDD